VNTGGVPNKNIPNHQTQNNSFWGSIFMTKELHENGYFTIFKENCKDGFTEIILL